MVVNRERETKTGGKNREKGRPTQTSTSKKNSGCLNQEAWIGEHDFLKDRLSILHRRYGGFSKRIEGHTFTERVLKTPGRFWLGYKLPLLPR